jgi:hypothetical protein
MGNVLTYGDVWHQTVEALTRLAQTEEAVAETLERLAETGSAHQRARRIEQARRAREAAETVRHRVMHVSTLPVGAHSSRRVWRSSTSTA